MSAFLLSATLALALGGSPATATTVVGPSQSIQAAIDLARPGDTILVGGRHRENLAVGTDGVTLRGSGAVLEPPHTPSPNACFDPTVEGESVHGICVTGDIDFESGDISRHVRNVTVSGFTVRGFTGYGITAAAARHTTIEGNVVQDDGDAGISVIASTDTRLLSNQTSGGRFGVFLGSAVGGRLAGNTVSENCVGVLMLNSLGPAGGFTVTANHIHHNTRSCPATADWPSLSGVGIALLGANSNTIAANAITANAPAGATELSSGVAVVASPDGTPSSDNLVTANTIRRNAPDILTDQTGARNRFAHNACETSTPAGLCG
jgi:parallel beta-helix repeat protein